MTKFKKFLALALTLSVTALSMGVFAGCGKSETVVRYLNFKPENAKHYEELARLYGEETGVKVIVETAANNEYESTLAAKMSTDEAPTLFQINGPKGYANWKDYCADLSGSELYSHLTDKSMAVKVDGKVYGIPYVVEGYGIIYNKAITDKYFALKNRNNDIKNMEEIDSFEELKSVVEDMQKNAQSLGIKGVFASTSLKTGEDWRWQTHLLNIPVYNELKTEKIDPSSDDTKTLTFPNLDNFKKIFDLYINNSVVDKKSLGTKTVTDSMAEFALEQCAMVQNGNWAWSQIADISGNKVKSENIKYLPIYMDIDGEEKQGLCIGTENFYAVNKKATEAEQKAAMDFINWLYTSEKGKKYVVEKLGFIAPFDTFSENETPTDPLAREVLSWLDKEDVENVNWNFTIFPSQTFKDNFGASLLKYAQGTKDWQAVKSELAADWAKESAAAV